MLDLIMDIENSLKHNCLRVALGMALTLPDICGQVEYPQVDKVGERYIKWCDQYLKNQGFITNGDFGNKVISGDMCYKLRCAYLHSGNIELNQREKDDFPKFRLLMCSKDDDGIYCEPLHKDLQGEDIMFTVDVRHLTTALCNAAKEYYEKQEYKGNFNDHHIEIDDVENTSNIVKIAQQRAYEIISKKVNKSDPKELSETTQKYLNDLKLFTKSFESNNDEDRINAMVARYELIYGDFIDFNSIVK